MIQKLRKQFVLINMGLVSVVLVTVFAAMALSSLRQVNRTADAVLSATLNSPFGNIQTPPQIDKRYNGGLERPDNQRNATLPTFSIVVDETGAITDSVEYSATVRDEVLADIVLQTLAQDKNRGTLSEYDLRYAIRYSSEGTRIAYVDISGSRSALMRQFLMLAIACVTVLAAFFGISIILSNWALRPVARSWERQRQFVADASHELKTPLSVVLANTDIVLSHPEDTVHSQLRWLQSTQSESLRMKSLVDDLLFLARADMDASPQMEPVCLSDVVLSALTPLESLAFEAGVRLETDVLDNVMLLGNGQQLKQLTATLLDNAIKYAGKGGTVTTRLFTTPDGIRLSVNNTGEPIDPDKLPHLFERFYRAEVVREHSAGGYGLGLAIAKSIAELHHANILVTSNDISGTTFTVEWRTHALAK